MEKKKVVYIVEPIKLFVNCLMIPLYFLKIICETAALPARDESGAMFIIRTNHYYSIYDKMFDVEFTAIIWIAIAIIVASIVVSVLSMILKEKKALWITSHAVFGVAVTVFLILLFVSKFVLWYAY